MLSSCGFKLCAEESKDRGTKNQPTKHGSVA